jgi:N-acyl-L-homoserine lactone synthetase
MVHVVDAANSENFATVLDQMFRDRARVVGDQLVAGFPQALSAEGRDRFDTASATYLLHIDRVSGRHLGSVRLLPTVEPHLLTVVGRALCACGSPVATDIWELSWFCVSPHLARTEDAWTRGLLQLAIGEFAASRGICQFSFLLCTEFLPAMMAAGWKAQPLGLPKRVGNLLIGAVLFTLTPDTLRQMRQQMGIYAPVLDSGCPHTSNASSLEDDYVH